MAVWMDVTTVLAWNRPPVGIVRTELECARQVIAYDNPSHFSLCYYDKGANEFFHLSKGQSKKLYQLLNGVYDSQTSLDFASIVESTKTAEDNEPITPLSRILNGVKSLIYTIDPVLNECIRGWVFDRKRPQDRVTIELRFKGESLCSKIANEYRPDLLDAGMSDGYCSFEVPIHEVVESFRTAKISPIEIRKAPKVQVFALTKKPQLIGEISINADALSRCMATDIPIDKGKTLSLGPGDVYLTAGLDWDCKDFSKIYAKKLESGFKIVAFCYDLIPVKFPHWCVGNVASFFSKYFTDLSWCADHIICISECSRNDYEQFAAVAGCPVVNTSVVRLGSALKGSRSSALIGSQVEEVIRSRYILFVSTVERRKNHEVLYRAYTRLVEKGVVSLPSLVFVGMPGWGVGELLADISLDPRTLGLIQIMDRVNDEELSLLYRNSLFTVFPSLYEGWGLPVAEALTHGKYCLVSNQGSLPEIAGDLLDYLDPWCVQEWADRIEFFLENPAALAEKERLVKKSFVADSWEVCVDQILNTASLVNDNIERAS